MRRTWTAMSVFLWACAGGQAPKTNSAVEGSAAQTAAETSEKGLTAKADDREQAPGIASNAKSASASGESGCKPITPAQPKTVAGQDTASESADTGQALIFDVAGIAVELPACTPEADVRVITVSWDTQNRPSPSRIHPNFTRHAATLRVDQMITARDGVPLLVRLHSKRELAKAGEKLVLAVETSGECDEQHKRDKLEDDGCAHWQMYDAQFDAQTNEMVARIPATGGYRMQFGWVPSK